MRCFQCRGVCRLAIVQVGECLLYNEIFSILTCNFSKEQYVLPEDDLRIETFRGILSVLM